MSVAGNRGLSPIILDQSKLDLVNRINNLNSGVQP